MQLSWIVPVLVAVLPAQVTSDSFNLESHRAWVRSQPQTFENPLLFRSHEGVVQKSDRYVGASGLTGDFDTDGDVDLHDYVALKICHGFSGPDVDIPPACADFDFDSDNDVDIADVGRFGELFTASIGAIQVDAGNLRPVLASPDGYYSGEPGAPDNNALKGIARQAGYTDFDLWYEWTSDGGFTISNPSFPMTSFWLLASLPPRTLYLLAACDEPRHPGVRSRHCRAAGPGVLQ